MSDNGRPAGFEAEQAELRESLRQIVAPLRQQLEVIEARIAENEAEHRSLVELRREATAVLRVADPEAKAKTKAKAKPGQRSARVSDERLEAIRDYLTDHADDYPDGFAISDLKKAEPMADWVGSLMYAMPLLVEEGTLRLDRKDYPPTNPNRMGTKSNIYKLVAVREGARK